MIFSINPDHRRDVIFRIHFLFFVVFMTIGILASGMSARGAVQPVPAESAPFFTDNASRDSLLAAARLHRSYLLQLPADYSSKINGTSYPRRWLLSSIDEFISLLETVGDSEQLNLELSRRFDIFQSIGRRSGPENTMLVTGYFEPVIPGSLTRTEVYKFPIYSVPQSLISRKNGKNGKTEVGRIDSGGNFRPYWTRAEIETSNILAGNELVYLKDPLAAFFLQIQGSGKVELPDGTTRSVCFAGHNGHGYKSIGKLLVDEGKLSLSKSSTPNIKKYLRDNPEEQTRILHHNPRVIFFAWGDDGPPKGSLGLPLTAGRSIAVDRSLLPSSVFYWMSTTLPILDESGKVVAWMPDTRFVLPQDSGAAIKGPGRVDLFMGSGHYARFSAGSMRQPGKLFFFIKKGYTAN